MTALGVLVRGPSALGDDATRFARLTWTLATTQFKLKFYGSALGYLWQLMRPLLLFGVLYVVFSVALNFGEGLRYFPVMLLLCVVLYTFVAEGLGSAVNSVVERENLVRKIEFPRMVIPTAAVLTAVFNLGLNLVAIPRFGINGAGAVSVIALALSMVMTAAIGRRYFALKFPFAVATQIVLASAAMGAMLWPLRGYRGGIALAGGGRGGRGGLRGGPVGDERVRAS